MPVVLPGWKYWTPHIYSLAAGLPPQSPLKPRPREMPVVLRSPGWKYWTPHIYSLAAGLPPQSPLKPRPREMPVVLRGPGWRYWAPHFGFLLALGCLFIVDSLWFFGALILDSLLLFWGASGGKVLRERGPGRKASGKKARVKTSAAIDPSNMFKKLL